MNLIEISPNCFYNKLFKFLRDIMNTLYYFIFMKTIRMLSRIQVLKEYVNVKVRRSVLAEMLFNVNANLI